MAKSQLLSPLESIEVDLRDREGDGFYSYPDARELLSAVQEACSNDQVTPFMEETLIVPGPNGTFHLKIEGKEGQSVISSVDHLEDAIVESELEGATCFQLRPIKPASPPERNAGSPGL